MMLTYWELTKRNMWAHVGAAGFFGVWVGVAYLIIPTIVTNMWPVLVSIIIISIYLNTRSNYIDYLEDYIDTLKKER